MDTEKTCLHQKNWPAKGLFGRCLSEWRYSPDGWTQSLAFCILCGTIQCTYIVERLHCKRPISICRLFFTIDLLTYIAALCITDFIDWRYIHSLVGIFDPACELLPPWTKELYLCTVAPLSSLWPPPPLSKLNVLFIQTVSVWGGEGGGWIVLCRSFSAGILHSVSDQMQNIPNYFTTPNEMTNENDIKGLVSLKFLRPWHISTIQYLVSITIPLASLLPYTQRNLAPLLHVHFFSSPAFISWQTHIAG